jgi:hypothetical protein
VSKAKAKADKEPKEDKRKASEMDRKASEGDEALTKR